MARSKKRQMNVFTLSFLDVMAGGFGAVVMIFLIINHQTEEEISTINRDQLAESRLLDYRAREREQDLAELREIVGQLALRIAEARERVESLQEEVEEKEEAVEEIEKIALDQSETLEREQSEIETREEEVKLLQEREESDRGPDVIAIEGEGDRQYLTGLFMGGSYILIALDGSASMLDSSLVNIRRRMHMPVPMQLQAPKWRQAVDATEWLVANIPVESNFQIIRYNNESELVVGLADWHPATDTQAVHDAIDSLRNKPPTEGTNLEQLFVTISKMQPVPDNIFLITDGLPTLENRASRRTVVDGRQRLAMFRRAVPSLPAGIPINVVMLPLEGDRWATGAYWNLAHVTSGTFMAPSKDWP
ncbi:MAG: VWA domain-containing protein [Gammaproteobacteria bacterium]|nr:VWA domain-containing protein [Gammaproteobacteria bacterium]